jgi:hypothetical protein
MNRSLIFSLTMALLTGTSCKTALTTEPRIVSAMPQGEVVTSDTPEPLGKTAVDPAKGYSFNVTINGASGLDSYQWTLREGQYAYYSPASNTNEIAIHMENDNARLYLGMNFEGKEKRQHNFGEPGSLPAMKVSVTNNQGEFSGRVTSGYLSIDLYDEKRGIIMGSFLLKAALNREDHELSGSFMMPLQIR